jgi:cysteine desulfurase/selenocysteine lyase
MSHPAPGNIDWAAVRAEFPILGREVHGKPLVYLDSANTSQKPRAVTEAVDTFLTRHNANVSRAVHALGSEATEAYENARRRLAAFLGVRAEELVLCSGTTFALNLVAFSWALPRLKPGEASCSPAWSTTPTSCPGSWWPSAPAPASRWPSSPPRANSTSRACGACSRPR